MAWAIGLGLAGALVSGLMLSDMLYQVTTVDPWALGAAMLLVSSAALLACWLPARWATKVNPMIALRTE